MQTVRRSALVPYSASDMYILVADIPRYSEFLNWCGFASVRDDTGGDVIASIQIAYRGLNKTFVTRNSMDPYHSISMRLVEGPFSELQGQWSFTSLGEDASKVELDLCFAFSSSMVEKVVGPVFSYIANHQVEAFHRRAQDVYGK